MEAALAIEGYMMPAELEWLAEQADGRKVIEVGSFKGRSTKALASTASKVWAVDHWGWQGPNLGADVSRWNSPTNAGDAYQAFSANLAPELAAGVVVAVPLRSSDAALWLAQMGVTASMVFLDAGHDKHDVWLDVVAYAPLLEPGGILCGHDYSPEFPGVVEAVDLLTDGAQVVPGTSIWWVVK